MPHPKNRLKLTGDTHLPDAGLDMYLDDDEAIDMVVFEEELRVYSDGYVPEAEPTSAPMNAMAEAAPEPLLAMSAALFFGWMVTRMLRR
jgi:hypothetical protein